MACLAAACGANNDLPVAHRDSSDLRRPHTGILLFYLIRTIIKEGGVISTSSMRVLIEVLGIFDNSSYYVQ